jgi:hypothetical protein
VRLERSAVKVACSVLRGLGEGDLAWLPGGRARASELLKHCMMKTKKQKQSATKKTRCSFDEVVGADTYRFGLLTLPSFL